VIDQSNRCPGYRFAHLATCWIAMQAAYDTWQAERAMAKEIRKIPTLMEA
jgi:plasmid maintenance system antidote protein VapI